MKVSKSEPAVSITCVMERHACMHVEEHDQLHVSSRAAATSHKLQMHHSYKQRVCALFWNGVDVESKHVCMDAPSLSPWSTL